MSQKNKCNSVYDIFLIAILYMKLLFIFKIFKYNCKALVENGLF